jgi:hypothetical protein
MLGVAERIVALMNEFRPLASELTHDRNERDYLVHVMMLRALRQDPSLSRPFRFREQAERSSK